MIDTMDCAQARISLGAYVLGALEPDGRAVVDAHLATCKACRAERADLEGLPTLLAVLGTEHAVALAEGLPRVPSASLGPTDSPAAPGPANHQAGLSATRLRRKTYRTMLLSVAVVGIVGLSTVGAAKAGFHAGQADAGPYAGPALGSWQFAQGSNAADMHATVRYRPMGWGTQVAVQVTGIPRHTLCAIEAYERNGITAVGGSWITDSSEGKVWYTASAAVSQDAVAKFVITVAGHPAAAITVLI